MTDIKTLTKADLLVRVGELEEQMRRLRKAEADRPIEPAPDPEAVAYGKCIAALDRAKGSRNSSSSFGYGSGDHTVIERLLRALAGKYGIELIQVRTEPCSRPHLDQIDTYAIGNAVSAALAQGDPQ